jgi:hypothetical protein
MKTRQIFWGVFLISIGILIMFRNYLHLEFGDIWQLWPLVIVMVGINIMIKNNTLKSVVAAVTAIILAVVLYASVTGIFGWFRHDTHFRFNHRNYDVTEYSAPYYKEIKTAILNVDAGAGSFIINDSTDLLFSAAVQGKRSNYGLTVDSSNSGSDILFSMESGSFFLNKNKVEFKLHPQPLWNLNFDFGAAAVDFDLSEYNIEDMDIDLGAASLKLKLGSKNPESRISIDAGFSSVNISVPEEAGCEIRVDASLSSRNFRDFYKYEDNIYRTDNFEDTDKKIILSINAAMSSINVTRHSW